MRAAGLVQTVLLGIFAAIGLLATLAVAVDWLQGLDTWFWRQATCTIDSAAVAEEREYGEYAVLLSYRYSFRGEEHVGEAYRHGGQGFERRSEAEVLASRYPAGSEVPCWVDPDDPDRSYLRRADLWQGLWILVPLVFVAVGVGGIWLTRALRSGGEERAEPPVSEGAAKRAKTGLGVGVLIVFFGIFFLFGTGVLVPFFVRPALQVLEALSWRETECEILSSGVRTHPGDDGATYSIDVLYRYEIDGREYRSNRYQFMGGSSSGYERRAGIVETLPAGASTVCWVDPTDPFEAVIDRGFTTDYLFGLLPLIFALVGLGGLLFAVGLLRRARRDAATPSWTATSEAATGSWSSGFEAEAATGPMVLEPTVRPLGKLGCAVVGSLFWNGFISIFVWHVVQDWRAGNPQWMPALILTPFVLIGLLLLSGIPYSILALLNPRPRLHLTPGVLRAGGSAHVEWAFRGLAGRVRRLRIWLEATETRTRTTTSSVRIESAPLDTPPVEILDRGRELPLEYGSVGFTLPEGTPPSSDGEPSVRWRLKLRGTIAWWPDVASEYDVRVLPAAER